MVKKAGKIALVLGLITGAVTGLIFAPEEGKKVRERIKKGDTKGLVQDLAAMGEDIKDMVVEIAKSPSVSEALDQAKDSIADVANLKRVELDEMLVKANKKADEFKKVVAKYVKEQKALLDKKAGAKKKTTEKKTTKKKTTAKKKPSTKKKTTTSKKAPAKKTTSKKKSSSKKKK